MGFAGMSLEMAKPPTSHTKTTLPPSIYFPGEAEIRYYLKCTVNLPGFLKQNPRAVSESWVTFLRTASSFLCSSEHYHLYHWSRRDHRWMVRLMPDVSTSSSTMGSHPCSVTAKAARVAFSARCSGKAAHLGLRLLQRQCHRPRNLPDSVSMHVYRTHQFSRVVKECHSVSL